MSFIIPLNVVSNPSREISHFSTFGGFVRNDTLNVISSPKSEKSPFRSFRKNIAIFLSITFFLTQLPLYALDEKNSHLAPRMAKNTDTLKNLERDLGDGSLSSPKSLIGDQPYRSIPAYAGMTNLEPVPASRVVSLVEPRMAAVPQATTDVIISDSFGDFVDQFVDRSRQRVTTLEGRLSKYTRQAGVPQFVRDERAKLRGLKKNLREAAVFQTGLRRSNGSRESVIDLLKKYASSPTTAQTRWLEETQRHVPELNETPVLFFAQGSFLASLFDLSDKDDGGMARLRLPAGELRIIVLRSEIEDALAGFSAMVHEGLHLRNIPEGGLSGFFESALNEGFTEFLARQIIVDFLTSTTPNELAHELRQQLNISFESAGGISKILERAFEGTRSLAYTAMLSTAEYLAGRLDSSALEEVYSGDFSLLYEKFPEVRWAREAGEKHLGEQSTLSEEYVWKAVGRAIREGAERTDSFRASLAVVMGWFQKNSGNIDLIEMINKRVQEKWKVGSRLEEDRLTEVRHRVSIQLFTRYLWNWADRLSRGQKAEEILAEAKDTTERLIERRLSGGISKGGEGLLEAVLTIDTIASVVPTQNQQQVREALVNLINGVQPMDQDSFLRALYTGFRDLAGMNQNQAAKAVSPIYTLINASLMTGTDAAAINGGLEVLRKKNVFVEIVDEKEMNKAVSLLGVKSYVVITRKGHVLENAKRVIALQSQGGIFPLISLVAASVDIQTGQTDKAAGILSFLTHSQMKPDEIKRLIEKPTFVLELILPRIEPVDENAIHEAAAAQVEALRSL